MPEVAGDTSSPLGEDQEAEEEGDSAEHLREDARLTDRDQQEDDKGLIDKAKDKLKGQ